MNSVQLKYVIANAQEGSMNKAARKLFVAQPNISRALRDLEEELQFTIFVRTPQGMQLTPIGEQFIFKAQSIVKETEQFYKLGQNDRKSLFCISLTRSSYLMDAISEWINEMEHGNPLSGYADIPYRELKKYPEIVHGDDARPFSSLYSDESSSGAAHQTESAAARKIYVYDRGSLIMLLHKLENAYMWTSPLPKEQLSLYHMVTRSCSFATNVMRDMLVYNPHESGNPLVSSCIRTLKQYAQRLEI